MNGAGSHRARASPVPGAPCGGTAARDARAGWGSPSRRRRGRACFVGRSGRRLAVNHPRTAAPRESPAIHRRPRASRDRPSARRPGWPRRGAPPQRRHDHSPPPLYASRGPAPPATRRTHEAPAARKDPARRPWPKATRTACLVGRSGPRSREARAMIRAAWGSERRACRPRRRRDLSTQGWRGWRRGSARFRRCLDRLHRSGGSLRRSQPESLRRRARWCAWSGPEGAAGP